MTHISPFPIYILFKYNGNMTIFYFIYIHVYECEISCNSVKSGKKDRRRLIAVASYPSFRAAHRRPHARLVSPPTTSSAAIKYSQFRVFTRAGLEGTGHIRYAEVIGLSTANLLGKENIRCNECFKGDTTRPNVSLICGMWAGGPYRSNSKKSI